MVAFPPFGRATSHLVGDLYFPRGQVLSPFTPQGLDWWASTCSYGVARFHDMVGGGGLGNRLFDGISIMEEK